MPESRRRPDRPTDPASPCRSPRLARRAQQGALAGLRRASRPGARETQHLRARRRRTGEPRTHPRPAGWPWSPQRRRSLSRCPSPFDAECNALAGNLVRPSCIEPVTPRHTVRKMRRGLRVLIVEDESLVSLFLQGVLQDLGHSVSGVAPSLRTALAIAAGTPSDLAIVDIGLAGDGGDGIDAAIALRNRYGIPALLMSGIAFDNVGPRLYDA